jgi:cytochrome P450
VRIAPDEVHFADIESVKHIYGVRDPFPKASWYSQAGDGMNSLFHTVDVGIHRRQRRLLSGAMSESSLKSVTRKVYERIDYTVQRMQDEVKAEGAFDAFKWFLFMATDIIGELSFGSSFQTLEQGKVW